MKNQPFCPLNTETMSHHSTVNQIPLLPSRKMDATWYSVICMPTHNQMFAPWKYIRLITAQIDGMCPSGSAQGFAMLLQ